MGGCEVGGLVMMLVVYMDFVLDDLQWLVCFWGMEWLVQIFGLIVVELFVVIGCGEVKVVWIMGINLVVLFFDSYVVSQVLVVCLLVIVLDVVVQIDIGCFVYICFLVLVWGEKNGMVINLEWWIFCQCSFLLLLGEVKVDWWIIVRVGQVLGYCEVFVWQYLYDVFCEYVVLFGFENDGQWVFDIGVLVDFSCEVWDIMLLVCWLVSCSEVVWDIMCGWYGDGRLWMVLVMF